MQVLREDGTHVHRGDKVTDFRDDVWTFVRADRSRSDGRTGKVVVADDQGKERDFYDTVFNLTVLEGDPPRPQATERVRRPDKGSA